MRNLLIALALTGVGACSSTQPQTPRETVSSTANYIGRAAGSDGGQNPAAVATAVSAALVSAAAAGTSSNEINGPHISGTCLLIDEAQSVPCASTPLVLLNDLGTEVARTRTTENGGFTFRVQSEKYYAIKPLSKKFLTTTEPNGKLTEGSQVILRITLK